MLNACRQSSQAMSQQFALDAMPLVTAIDICVWPRQYTRSEWGRAPFHNIGSTINNKLLPRPVRTFLPGTLRRVVAEGRAPGAIVRFRLRQIVQRRLESAGAHRAQASRLRRHLRGCSIDAAYRGTPARSRPETALEQRDAVQVERRNSDDK